MIMNGKKILIMEKSIYLIHLGLIYEVTCRLECY